MALEAFQQGAEWDYIGGTSSFVYIGEEAILTLVLSKVLKGSLL